MRSCGVASRCIETVHEMKRVGLFPFVGTYFFSSSSVMDQERMAVVHGMTPFHFLHPDSLFVRPSFGPSSFSALCESEEDHSIINIHVPLP